MNTIASTTTPGATKVTPCGYYYTAAPAPPIECHSGTPGGGGLGAGSAAAKEEGSRVLLLLCLRGIATFCWAASRRTLERMLLAYLQSAVNPTWHSLIASITAGPRGAPSPEDLRDKEGGVVARQAAGGACASPKKVFWSYLRGA